MVMSARSIIVVVLALVCGLSAAWGMNEFRKNNRVEVKPDTGSVVVATVDMVRGQVVVEKYLTVAQWPKELVPADAVTKLEDAVDRSAKFAILAGDPVLTKKLASKDSGRGMAALIPLGMRAYTIIASKVNSNVAGFILPGSRVDILLNLRASGRDDETGGGSTTTLLQAVEILAVDQALDAPIENKMDVKSVASVTLLVSPDQAAVLDLGQNMGTLTLALRNPEDQTEAKTTPALLADIRYRQDKPLKVVNNPDSSVVLAVNEEVVEAVEEEPETASIMTLRGGQWGQVIVTAGHSDGNDE
jgi:pilus assembly protein CpaB